jgi:hypothetical protein
MVGYTVLDAVGLGIEMKGDSFPQEKDRLHATIILERLSKAVENHI